jgi:hypothetical protein
MEKNHLFDMIKDIQKKRPDWRFCLLGGDMPREYKRSKSGKILGYKRSRKPFGWQAEFFGLRDGKTFTTQRIQSGFYLKTDDAILIACAMATKAIRQGVK